MQKYKYIAVDIDKKKFKGYFLAENEDDLRIQLSRQKLYLIRAVPMSDKPPSSFFSVSGKVKTVELTTFCRQFAIMIGSGISIVESLNILKEQSYSSFFRRVISSVYEDVKVGVLLSDAMAKHKKVFPHFFTSMTYVGEQSGMLDEVLRSVADYYETDAKIKRKTRSAMIYPAFLAILMLAIVVLMVAFVIPTFEKSLSAIEVDMPAITVAIMNISHWFVSYWMYLFLGIVLVVIILVAIGRTEKGKYVYHTILLKMPIIGKVQTALISSRFARGFGLLLSGGMDVVDAMEVISAVLGNKNVEQRFRLAIADVREGKSLTASLTAYKLFPTILIQMVSVGEKTGSVDKVLLQSGSYFDEQAERSLSSMTTLIQPIMLGIMGAVVGLLFVAIYSPMLSIMKTL
ncbi:MAG: type II secretion system F family protein [Eubacteriales bacterium]